MPDLTPERRAELRRLYEPIMRENFHLDLCLQRRDWEESQTSRPSGCVTVRNSIQGHRIRDIHDVSCDEAAFIVAAHNDFPALLAAADERDRLAAEVAALRREVEVLRDYGNKDCTAMADEALIAEDDTLTKGPR